jgi:hypothetical protein
MSITPAALPVAPPADIEKGPTSSSPSGEAKNFNDMLSINITNFKDSRFQAMERLGVILLLDYKIALDLLNRHYHVLISHIEDSVSERRDYNGELYNYDAERYSKSVWLIFTVPCPEDILY